MKNLRTFETCTLAFKDVRARLRFAAIPLGHLTLLLKNFLGVLRIGKILRELHVVGAHNHESVLSGLSPSLWCTLVSTLADYIGVESTHDFSRLIRL